MNKQINKNEKKKKEEMGEMKMLTTSISIASVTSVAFGKLDPQTVAIEVVVISAVNSILCVSVMVKGDKGKCGRTARSLQINIQDSAILVEQVIQLSLLNVKGKVSNVYTGGSHFLKIG